MWDYLAWSGSLVLTGVAIFFMIFGYGYWSFHLIALVRSYWKLNGVVSERNPELSIPAVSIIKPLMGIDPNLQSNLESFFTSKYPKFELLFCVQDATDPAISVVHNLIGKYPLVDSTLFIGGRLVGINPKINNMQPAYEAAKHELILISDSGIRMQEDTVMDMVSHMNDRVGLVHQIPFACDRPGFSGILEKVYFGTAHARIYLVADCIGVNCTTGMSFLMRKQILDDVGGIKAFGCYLAEDFFFAKSMTDRGWKLAMSSQPAWQNSGACEISSFRARMSRWAKLRFAMVPPTILFEPIAECMVLGICVSLATARLLTWDPTAIFLIHVLTWCILDWCLLSSIQYGPLPFSKMEFVRAWLFRETIAPLLFLQALLSPNIQWRQGSYRLQWGGVAEEISKIKL